MTLQSAFLFKIILLIVTVAISSAFNITIIHTNDFHSHFSPFVERSGVLCLNDTTGCVGGIAQQNSIIQGLINKTHTAGEEYLLLDAGDQFQGTLYFIEFGSDLSTYWMNHAGYDAMCLGNHEFDRGTDFLSQFIKSLNFPVIDSNMDWSNVPAFSGLPNLMKSKIIFKGGVAIGLIGYITEDLPILSHSGAIVVQNTVAALLPVIADLQSQGANIIIAISHAGYDVDQQVAAAVPGIDIIVGGHSHTFLSSTDPSAAGPYPTVITNSQSSQKTCIVQSSEWGKYIGHLQVSFDDSGNVLSCTGAPIHTNTTELDPVVKAFVDTYTPALDALITDTIGSSDCYLEQAPCRDHECTLGSFVADAMLADANEHAPTHATIFNGGTLRSAIPNGLVSTGSILGVDPFSDTIVLLELNGSVIKLALENGASRLDSNGSAASNSGTGRFSQVAGIRYTLDPSRPPGQRIPKVQIRISPNASTYETLNQTKIYRIATLTYPSTGGDGYWMFANLSIDRIDTGDILSEIMADYVNTTSPVKCPLAGRISIIYPKHKTSRGIIVAAFVVSLIVVVALIVLVLWRFKEFSRCQRSKSSNVDYSAMNQNA